MARMMEKKTWTELVALRRLAVQESTKHIANITRCLQEGL